MRWLIPGLALAAGVCVAHGAEPVRYRVSLPEPEHRWMAVEATFTGVGDAPLQLRMSRSSPGRYSLHDFAKNVYDVRAFNSSGRELPTSRPDPYGWSVSGHDGNLTVKYKVFGDRVDGTYLAIDRTHAHINMPAAFMWARGFDERPITVRFEPPAGAAWYAMTQLQPVKPYPTSADAAVEYSAPNLQYFMDSPVEFAPSSIHMFDVDGTTFRFSLHHTGTDAEFRAYLKDVEKIVREERTIFADFPRYESRDYWFLADYLPWAEGDGMEHRNSTVMTSRGTIAQNRPQLLDTVAHEFFHCWNVERIRPRGLEPFDFERANVSSELWLAEGFTSYYAPLVLQRAGINDLETTAATFGSLIDTVVAGSGRLVRSAEEMSQMAAFIDQGRTTDRTNWSNTVISYYPFGAAIGLALDLSLRERSGGRVTLDDFMRAMWQKFGKPGGSREGYVDRPYSGADAETTLAEVSGDAGFVRDFFARYVRGHEVADYARLLANAGLTVRKPNPARAWLGDISFNSAGETRIATAIAPQWPIYAAGIEEDDELRQVDDHRIASVADLTTILARRKPGELITIQFVDRAGVPRTSTIRLAEDPHVEVVAAESSALTREQRQFRERWLKSRT